MGIKILKPIVYLGNNKFNLQNLFKKKYDFKNSIGSSKVHIEKNKDVYGMALKVSKQALKTSKKKPNFLIFVSQTQEKNIPSCAEKLAHNINISNNSFVFTISSGCSGFVQALFLANKLLSNLMPRGLIVCAEKYSNIIGEKSLKTKLLFSDAASATCVDYTKKKNILESFFGFDGENSKALEVNRTNNNSLLNMDGNKLLMFTMRNMPRIIKTITDKNKKVDKYLIHPGSKILLDNLIKKSEINPSLVPNTFNITGNTVSSSIPLLIKENFKKIKFDNKILLSGFGVGLSHATLLIKWA